MDEPSLPHTPIPAPHRARGVLRAGRAHPSGPRGPGAGSAGTYMELCVWTGGTQESTLRVPARSPIPAAAHTGARLCTAPAYPTPHPRPSSRPSGCPHSARVPLAEQESVHRVLRCTEAGDGGNLQSSGKKAGNSPSAQLLRTTWPREAQGCRRRLPTPGGAGCSTPASPALGGGLPAELSAIGSSVIAQRAQSAR